MLKFNFSALFYLLWSFFLLSSCSTNEILTGPIINFAIPADGFKIEIGKSLVLNPEVLNDAKSTYTWEINGQVVATSKSFTFTPLKIGSYSLQLKVSNEIGNANKSVQISAFSSLSPYISKVFEYQYAPGQHASLIASNCKGEDFIGQPWTGTKSYTSLGGWGGYIIAGFDHDIKNTNGADFGIFTQPGAGSEPAVIFVMNDNNNDGIPNDGEWFEVKGSEYNHSETIHEYQVTYYKPASNGNVNWKDNKNHSGELKPVFDSSSWWWSGYGSKTEITFSGTKLPSAYINIPTQSGDENWAVRTGVFNFGYAECYNNLDYNNALKANLLDISNVVDKSGNKANLTAIKFIKIQCGVFQIAGWLNEISTEVSGAVDLSLVEYAAN